MVKLADHEGVDDNGYSKKFINRSCHLGAFIVSHSKTLMNDVVIALDEFKNHKIYYSDTDGTYIHRKDYEVLKEQNLIGKDLYQSRNEYGDAGIVYAFLISAKIKYYKGIDDNDLLQQNITFKECDRGISQIEFKNFLNIENGLIVPNTYKTKSETRFTCG